ncbi:MAG: adenylyl-sulfate kinase [Deltaproteobacteria bacterium]|nr:adenylyl-sulfate kinase [Deltaproteobacteria bacterium]
MIAQKSSLPSNITWHDAGINSAQRQKLNGHKSGVIWLTGLSGSGKSTLANLLDAALHRRKVRSYVLDGDNLRHGLNRDLGFSATDRKENIRRVGETAKLMADAGLIVITAFISPYRSDRDAVRELISPGVFIETWIDCSLEICRQRDPKGLYKKADAGEIADFTGISAPYEPPLNPEITVCSDRLSETEAVAEIIAFLQSLEIIK